MTAFSIPAHHPKIENPLVPHSIVGDGRVLGPAPLPRIENPALSPEITRKGSNGYRVWPQNCDFRVFSAQRQPVSGDKAGFLILA